MKREKSFAEVKTFCSKCLAKDIKLSSFLGGNLSEILNFVVRFVKFCVFDVLVLILLEILFFLSFFADFLGQRSYIKDEFY